MKSTAVQHRAAGGNDSLSTIESSGKSHSGFIRFVQRYLIPHWFVSIFHLVRDRAFISRQARVQFSGRIVFGKAAVVKPFAIIQTQGGMIRIGHHVAISNFDHITTGIQDIIIGDYSRIAPNVTILGGSRNFHKRDVLILHQGSFHAGVTIGSDVLIGAGAVIMPGCRIGSGAVVGANSVVNMDLPEYSISAGIPAKIIGNRQ